MWPVWPVLKTLLTCSSSVICLTPSQNCDVNWITLSQEVSHYLTVHFVSTRLACNVHSKYAKVSLKAIAFLAAEVLPTINLFKSSSYSPHFFQAQSLARPFHILSGSFEIISVMSSDILKLVFHPVPHTPSKVSWFVSHLHFIFRLVCVKFQLVHIGPQELRTCGSKGYITTHNKQETNTLPIKHFNYNTVCACTAPCERKTYLLMMPTTDLDKYTGATQNVGRWVLCQPVSPAQGLRLRVSA